MSRQIKLTLDYPFRYNWDTLADLYILCQVNQEAYTTSFDNISSLGTATEVLNNANSHFAVVLNREHFLLAAVDRVRSFPLFYKDSPGEIRITDNIERSESEFILHETGAVSFQNIFCCEGRDTLLQGWRQLQPGDFMYYDKSLDQLTVQRYFSFGQHDPVKIYSDDVLRDLYLDEFRQILAEANGRPLIVPLSGGYDSRCILACLKLLGAENIFCYTYGRRNSFERTIAEQVARKLQLDWHFVEYNNGLLDIFGTDAWQTYSDKNHHFTSLPHEQDFFALFDLRQKGLLPHDGIVLPGFLGDYFAGSMFKDHNRDDVDPIHYQDWYISNRGCKFILNAVRVYEYFGLEWRVPFASKSILEYWLSVPLEERLCRDRYNDQIMSVFFRPLGIDIRKPDHHYRRRPVRARLKSWLPDPLLRLLREFKANRPGQDPNNTAYLKAHLIREEGQFLKNMKISFNEAHARYFLRRLHEKLLTLGNNTRL